MKTLSKVLLIVSLFCTFALADDGDMGNGGLWASKPETKIVTEDDGDMGNGGKTCPNGQTTCFAVDDNGGFNFYDLLGRLIASTF